MEALAFAGLALLSGGVTMCRHKTKPEVVEETKEEADGVLRIAYWNMCGLGQPIRLLAAYGGVPHKDVRYKVTKKEDGSWDKSHWFDEKFKLGLSFPNLPYLIDGDVELTETNAVLTYLGEKAGLAPPTAEGRAQVTMLLGIVMDLRNAVVRTAYGPKDEYAGRLEKLAAKAPTFFDKLGSFMEGRDWLAPFGLSAPDFHFYELLRQLQLMIPSCLDKYPALKAYMARFEALPAIAKYQASSDYIARPCNNPYAAFK